MMPNSDSEGRIFLATPNNHDSFFFLHTFRPPAFDFNVRVTMNKSHCFTLMSAILKVDVVCDIIVRVSKIRFVSTCENRGKPRLVCKNSQSGTFRTVLTATFIRQPPLFSVAT